MTRRSATPAVLPLLAAGAAMFLVGSASHRHALAKAPSRPRYRVVVLGAGFGGLNAALPLAQSDAVDLTVIDVQNHHLFQPLLYQVATAALSPADIASPVRDVIPALPRTHVMMGAVTGIDTAAREVLCSGQRVPYDDLIIATGSQPSYFGNHDWAEFAPGLKTLHDALDLRGRILLAFERACVEQDPAERDRLLTFVLIGAGPTGVEMAGSIAELSRETLAQDHELSRVTPKIILIEAGKRVLEAFPEDLSADAARALRALGVEVRTGAKVTGMGDGVVHLEHGSIPAATIVWAAGTEATPVAQWLGVKPGHGGRVEVGPDLTVPGLEGVRVIGDAALAKGADGKPLPGLAPVAKQQGEYVASAILRHLAGRPAPRPFRYRDYGTLATIGRAKAVADFGALHLSGLTAWLLWAVAHIFFLIGFRNRLMVSLQWAIAFAANRRPGRLIAGAESPIDATVTGHTAHK
jgi:NADH dehydrogenase